MALEATLRALQQLERLATAVRRGHEHHGAGHGDHARVRRDEDVDLNPYINQGSVVEGESTGQLPEDDVSYDGEGVFTVHPL